VSSESNESYYEIALTHREVLVAFVAILACVLGAFLGGVWLGRRGADELLAQERLAGDAVEAEEVGQNGEDIAELEEFRFFSGEEEGAPSQDEGLSKPDLSKLLDEPDKETTLAEDVGSTPRPRGAKSEAERRAAQERRRRRQERQDTAQPSEKQVPGQEPSRQEPSRQEPSREQHSASTPPPPPPASAPPPPTTTAAIPPPSAPPAAPQEGFVIQVFSTHDQPQARKVLNQLQGGGFLAFMSPVEVDGATMYRVRIGPFEDKAQAETSAAQVRQKFKLDTWVTAASN